MKMLVLLLFAAGLLCGAEKIIPESYGFRQSTQGLGKDRMFGDPEFKKLTDGITDKPENRCLWNRKQSGRPVNIDVNFPEPVRLESLKLFYFRALKGYPILEVAVTAIGKNDEQTPLGQIFPNQQNTADKQGFDSFTVPLDPKIPVSRARVTVNFLSNLALTEMEFSGTPEKAKTAEAKPEKSTRFADLPLKAGNGLRYYEIGDAAQGSKAIVLENDRAIYVIDPVNGGVVNYAYDRERKVNFVKPAGRDAFGGMFVDRFHPSNEARNAFRNQAYSAEVAGNGSNEIRVTVKAKGNGGMFDEVTCNKTYTLSKDSIALRCDYAVENGQANVIPINYGLWISGGVCSEEPFDMVYRGESGAVKKISTRVEPFANSSVQGWSAILTKSGNGLALLTDFSRLKQFIFWGADPRETTLEAKLGVYEIPANESMETTAYLIPFHGLEIPDRVNEFLCSKFSFPSADGGSPELLLYPVCAGDYSISIEGGLLRGKKVDFKTLFTGNVRLEKSLWKTRFPGGFTAPGTYVFRVNASLAGSGRRVFSADASCSCRKAGEPWHFAADGVKKAESVESAVKIDLNFQSPSFQTPAIPWARPFSGGKPRVLLVANGSGAIRDMVELRQRVDMDLTVNYIGGVYSISGLYAALNRNECHNELSKALQKDYDVIVTAGNVWQTLPRNLVSAILEKNRTGTGLVMISPEGEPQSFGIVRNAGKKERQNPKEVQWKAGEKHPVCAGIPWEAMPPTLVKDNRLPDSLETAGAGNVPLIQLSNEPARRVALVNWNVANHSKSDQAVLPVTRGKPTWDFWEYQQSLLGKVIVWASGKKSNVVLDGITAAADGHCEIALNAEKEQKVLLTLTIRDSFSRMAHVVKSEQPLHAGLQNIRLDFPQCGMDGIHFADLTVAGSSGTECWGSAVFRNRAADSIAGVDADRKRIHSTDDDFAFTVRLRNGAADRVRVEMLDSFGNVFAAQTVKGGGTLSFKMPLSDCRTCSFKLVTSALDSKGVEMDRREEEFQLYAVPDSRRLNLAFGWPNLEQIGIQPQYYRYYYGRLKELGANVLRPHGTDTLEGLLLGRSLNLPFIYSRAPMTCDSRYPHKSAKKIAGKLDIVRTPCISAPGFKDELEKRNSLPAKLEEYGSIFRGGPDEASSINFFDGCFSPACLTEFRNWLKKQYPSLEALNQSWDTHYRSWDEVIAMTAEEAKKHTSFAPWLDHMTFNDWNRADAIGRIADGSRKANPQLRYSLSGTQNTNAFNAYDWYLLMRHFDALESYGGEQVVMQESFREPKDEKGRDRGRLLRMPWIGYDTELFSLRRAVMSALMSGASGFCVYNGRLYMNPDYTFPKKALELQGLFSQISNGPAELLIGSDYVPSPVALHYSPASIKIDWMLALDMIRKNSVGGWGSLLSDCGSNYTYSAYGQLEKNGVPPHVRVLILSGSLAMSKAETEAVKRFVANGGTVIADLPPALYDEHGKRYPSAPLAEVFGVKDFGTLRIADALTKGNPAKDADGLSLSGYEAKVKAFYSGIVPDGAKVLGKTVSDDKVHPAFLIHNYGKGKALYLGAASGAEYFESGVMRFAPSRKPSVQSFQAFLGKLMAEAKAAPVFRAVRPDGELIFASALTVRNRGPVRILGIVRDPFTTMKFDRTPLSHTVELDKEYHVYDLFGKRYLGQVKSFPYVFGPETHAVFVLLPYRVQDLSLSLRRNRNRVELSGMLNVQGNSPDRMDHIFRLELLEPSGKSNRAYDSLIFGKGNCFDCSFALPLNAEKGTWTVRVTDSLSQCKAERKIEL